MKWQSTKNYGGSDYCNPPELPGCYAIYGLNFIEKTKRLLYIGTATNLYNRIKTPQIYELLEKVLQEYEIPFFKIKVIESSDLRLDTEKRLIKRLLPPLNKILYNK